MQKKLSLSLFIFTIIATLIIFGQPTDASASSGFQVENGVLKDSNGNSFVIRGINNPHIWYDTKAYNALDEIAKTGANTVRIVWDTNGSASRLEKIIKRCIELDMIAMPELHCATGTDCTEEIKDRARYWARDDVSAVLKIYQEYVIVNIANEPGYSSCCSTLTDEVWRDVYKDCIDIMRNAGITNTIVIDARSFAQDYYCVAKYGQDLIDYDPLHNLMFGIHMYVEWNDRNKIIEKLDLLKSKNLPIVIAEFGYNYNNGNNNLHCKVDAQIILDECEKHGFGYMAWSWAGNNEENAWLDMTSNWVNYTEWGDFLINGMNGIKETSKICSVFKETSEQIIALSVSEGSLNPSFDSDIINYSVEGAHDINSIDITATLSDENASMTINGETSTSGEAVEIILNGPGLATMIEIVVIAEDGKTIKIYTITVNREKKDHLPAIYWQHDDGALKAWFMDGTVKVNSEVFESVEAGWKVKGVIDANGNGTSDIYLYNRTAGEVELWLMDGLEKDEVISITNPHQDRDTIDPVWEMMAVYDLDGSGEPDIIWQALEGANEGDLAVWMMEDQEAYQTSRIYNRPDETYVNPDWEIGSIYDFLGDGEPEVIWQAVGGAHEDQLAYWKLDMNTFERVASARIYNHPGDPVFYADWRLNASLDLFDDGIEEFLFHNIDGRLAYWRLEVDDPDWGVIRYDSGHLVLGEIAEGWLLVGACN